MNLSRRYGAFIKLIDNGDGTYSRMLRSAVSGTVSVLNSDLGVLVDLPANGDGTCSECVTLANPSGGGSASFVGGATPKYYGTTVDNAGGSLTAGQISVTAATLRGAGFSLAAGNLLYFVIGFPAGTWIQPAATGWKINGNGIAAFAVKQIAGTETSFTPYNTASTYDGPVMIAVYEVAGANATLSLDVPIAYGQTGSTSPTQTIDLTSAYTLSGSPASVSPNTGDLYIGVCVASPNPYSATTGESWVVNAPWSQDSTLKVIDSGVSPAGAGSMVTFHGSGLAADSAVATVTSAGSLQTEGDAVLVRA